MLNFARYDKTLDSYVYLDLNSKKFFLFSFKHCSLFGIKDNYYNVYSNKRQIGYCDGFPKNFIRSFNPVSDWKNTFSVGLKERLALV